MTFILQMVSALMEPVGMIGYVLCGVFLRRMWIALPAAVAWAIALQVWDAASERARYAVSSPELLFPRIVVALAVAAIVFYLIDSWRQSRAERVNRS